MLLARPQIGHFLFLVTLKDQSCLRLVKVLTGEVMHEKLCSIFNLSQDSQDSFVAQSWPNGLFIFCGLGKHRINGRIHQLLDDRISASSLFLNELS